MRLFRIGRSLICLLITLSLIGGCASTGRGEFPTFPDMNREDKTLAVLPIYGAEGDRLKDSILYHLDRKKISETFGTVKIISKKSVKNILNGEFSPEGLTQDEAEQLKKAVEAPLVLALTAHDLQLEKFTTTETERLEQTNTRYQNTDVDQGGGSSNDASINTYETEYSTQEVPVTEGNVRAVLSMSALVYDLNKNRTIWSGRRIERAQGQLEDLSSIELMDIVVERIMYQIVSQLTAE